MENNKIINNKLNYNCEKYDYNKNFNENLFQFLGHINSNKGKTFEQSQGSQFVDLKNVIKDKLEDGNCRVNKLTILTKQLDDENSLNNIRRYIVDLKNIRSHLENKNDFDKVNTINDYVNKFKYQSDMKNYKKSDYLASPIEMISKRSGDCEDYAILKFNILVQEFKMDPTRFGFVYGYYGEKKEPHMVLSYKSPDGRNLILDNNSSIYNLKNQNKFEAVFEVHNNQIIQGNNKYILKDDSKYKKLVELSLPKEFSKEVLEETKAIVERKKEEENIKELASL